MDSKGSSSSLLPFNPEKEPRSSSLLAPSSHLPTNTTSSTTSSSTPTMTTSMFMETTSYSESFTQLYPDINITPTSTPTTSSSTSTSTLTSTPPLPSLSTPSSSSSSSSSSSHAYDVCSLCWRGEEDRPEPAFRDWVECDFCGHWYHAVCLHTPFAELTKLSKFRCPTCVVENGVECTSEHYGKGIQTFVKSINERMKLIYRVYKEVSRIHVPDATQKWLEDVISKPHPEYTPSSLCKPTFSQCFMPGGLLSFETNASDSKRKRK